MVEEKELREELDFLLKEVKDILVYHDNNDHLGKRGHYYKVSEDENNVQVIIGFNCAYLLFKRFSKLLETIYFLKFQSDHYDFLALPTLARSLFEIYLNFANIFIIPSRNLQKIENPLHELHFNFLMFDCYSAKRILDFKKSLGISGFDNMKFKEIKANLDETLSADFGKHLKSVGEESFLKDLENLNEWKLYNYPKIAEIINFSKPFTYKIYTYLSDFVHGGAYSLYLMQHDDLKEKDEKVVINFITIITATFVFSYSRIMQSFFQDKFAFDLEKIKRIASRGIDEDFFKDINKDDTHDNI